MSLLTGDIDFRAVETVRDNSNGFKFLKVISKDGNSYKCLVGNKEITIFSDKELLLNHFYQFKIEKNKISLIKLLKNLDNNQNKNIVKKEGNLINLPIFLSKNQLNKIEKILNRIKSESAKKCFETFIYKGYLMDEKNIESFINYLVNCNFDEDFYEIINLFNIKDSKKNRKKIIPFNTDDSILSGFLEYTYNDTKFESYLVRVKSKKYDFTLFCDYINKKVLVSNWGEKDIDETLFQKELLGFDIIKKHLSKEDAILSSFYDNFKNFNLEV